MVLTFLDKSKYTVPLQLLLLNRAVILSKQKIYLRNFFQGIMLPVRFFCP